MGLLVENFNENDFENYRNCKNKETLVQTIEEQALILRFANIVEIENIFNQN
jgi:hypothetical protein